MKKYYGVDSVFGGKDYYDEHGRLVGHSVPGIGGGEDFYGVNGETGYSVDSALGGQDYYGSNGERAYERFKILLSIEETEILVKALSKLLLSCYPKR